MVIVGSVGFVNTENAALCLPEMFLIDRTHVHVFSRRWSAITGFMKPREHLET